MCVAGHNHGRSDQVSDRRKYTNWDALYTAMAAPGMPRPGIMDMVRRACAPRWRQQNPANSFWCGSECGALMGP